MRQSPRSARSGFGSPVGGGIVALRERDLDRSSFQRLLINPLEIGSRFSCRQVNVDRSTKRLAIAILTQALRDVLLSENLGKKQVLGRWHRDALKWFASDEDHPGSLRWVSEIVDIEVEDIRRWVSVLPAETAERRKWQARFRRSRRRF